MRLRPFLLVALLAHLSAAQPPDTTQRAPGASVSGVVRDSIARAPLPGAMVQLVDADSLARFGRMVISDSLGRFTFDGVPDGRYTLGFLHPLLDSLGVEAPLREVYVDGQRPVRADLAIPSAARLREAICGPRSKLEGGAVVVGVIRDAHNGTPMAGVTVTGEWLEVSFRPGGVVRHVPRVHTTTSDDGWFAICNVPNSGTMWLLASRGADSTDHIEVKALGVGFLRREMFLGSVRSVFTRDTLAHADSQPPRVQRKRVGEGRISGVVFSAAEGGPVAGAQVSIAEGPQTRANERGEWTLVDVPPGTRMIDVRALGFYPGRHRVDVVSGAPPVYLAMSTLKAVLDTVRILARSLQRGDRNGFEERRRTGAGYYLTPKDIARIKPIVLSELFRATPFVQLSDTERGDKRLFMKGPFGLCSPAIYLDGQWLGERTNADDIDTWVRPRDVTGVEIHSETTVPPQFPSSQGDAREPTLCGSILIWTK